MSSSATVYRAVDADTVLVDIEGISSGGTGRGTAADRLTVTKNRRAVPTFRLLWRWILPPCSSTSIRDTYCTSRHRLPQESTNITDQTETRAAKFAIGTWTRLDEALEQSNLLFIRHPESRVCDGDVQSQRLRGCTQNWALPAHWQQVLQVHFRPGVLVGFRRLLWRARRAEPNTYDATRGGFGELDGVADKVDDDLNEPTAIAPDPLNLQSVDRLVPLEMELDATCGNLVPKHSDGVHDLVAGSKVGWVQCHKTRTELGHVKHV
jgi:hypothetical protein